MALCNVRLVNIMFINIVPSSKLLHATVLQNYK